jgi:hypothetical protein
LIPQDKLLHFIGGIVLGVVFGAWVAVVIGALKEVVYDYLLKKGTPEFDDFLATALGGGLVLLLQKIF